MMMRRWLPVCAVLLLLLLPAAALADELVAELNVEWTIELGEEIDRSAAYEAYVSQTLGLIPRDVSRSSRDWLTPVQQSIYDLGAARLKDIAAGRTDYTRVEIYPSMIGLSSRHYYPEDLGLTSLVNEDGEYNGSAIVNGIFSDIITKNQMATILWNLVYDHPREVYWFGNKIKYGMCS